MERVFILTTTEKIIAVYNNEEIANKIKPICEAKFNIKINIITKILNPDFNIIGNNELDT